MRKYWVIFNVAAAERLVYRGDFFISTFLRFIPIVTTIVLWGAIYDGSGRESLGGLRYPDMVAYYLLVMISRAFGSMPGLASTIALDVREGNLRKFLIQPVNYVLYYAHLRAAHKIVYFITAFLPFAIVFWLCRDYLPGWPRPVIFITYLTSLILAFLLGFLINTLMGLLSFWFLEVTSFLFIFMVSQYFLSGHMFPLSLLPDGMRQVVTLLPFAYETYYPAMIMLGKLDAAEALGVVAIQAAWITGLGMLVMLAWRRGLRRYAAFGG